MNKHTGKELPLQRLWQEVWVLGNLFQWTNLLRRNPILAKNVTRSSNNIVSWTNSHWWETSSLQRMWHKFGKCVIVSHEQTYKWGTLSLQLHRVWQEVLVFFFIKKLKLSRTLSLQIMWQEVWVMSNPL